MFHRCIVDDFFEAHVSFAPQPLKLPAKSSSIVKVLRRHGNISIR
jgi:hypothetical protein